MQMGNNDFRLTIVIAGNIVSHNTTELESNKSIWNLASGNMKSETTSEIIRGSGIISILIWALFAISILILAASLLLIIVKLQ